VLLKKQTVWLLTMLSLVVVLSVYYITSPEGTQEDYAFEPTDSKKESAVTSTEEKQVSSKDTAAEEKGNVKVEEADDGTVISQISSDELFTALRMEIEEERSKLIDEYKAILASSDVTAEEKSKVVDKMHQISEVAQKEKVLETLIKSKGYEDALVRADGNKVKITVKAKKHSPAAANEIIQLVRTELNDLKNVAVEFQTGK
jgi:stage III sporulation protein AH